MSKIIRNSSQNLTIMVDVMVFKLRNRVVIPIQVITDIKSVYVAKSDNKLGFVKSVVNPEGVPYPSRCNKLLAMV